MIKINKTIVFYFGTFSLGLMIGIGSILAYIEGFSFLPNSFLTPLGLSPQILSTATRIPSKKPLMGFLPYWMVNQADIQYHLLDYLIYFSVTLNADGTIKKYDGNNLDIGWYRFQSEKVSEMMKLAQKNEVKTAIAITVFHNDTIDAIVSNANYRAQAIESIKYLINEYELDAVNIDFEYNMTNEARDDTHILFANFLKELREAIPDKEISVDLYANAFIKNFPYDVEKIQPQVDHLVLMGYDFHRANSANSGPVAPLKAENGVSITKAVQSAFDKKIDPGKIILAMPLYGYEWSTVSDKYKANTYQGSGVMASYKRTMELIEKEKIEPQWDSLAMSPWLSYEVDNTTQQIYYEDDQSLGYKLQLIDQVQLAGGAFWALGYEGKDASLWYMVEDWRRKH